MFKELGRQAAFEKLAITRAESKHPTASGVGAGVGGLMGGLGTMLAQRWTKTPPSVLLTLLGGMGGGYLGSETGEALGRQFNPTISERVQKKLREALD